MDELISGIDKTVIALMKHDLKDYQTSAQDLAEKMIVLFPVIADVYKDPRMQELREDAAYWPDQLERVIAAFGRGDYFEVADVLYNETRPNLIELKEVLSQKGML